MELTTNIPLEPGDSESFDVPSNQLVDGKSEPGEKSGAKVGRGIYIPPPPDSRPCVVCKKVHLSCDRMRPCGRCIRLQREAECCDPPISRRGRKLRDTPELDEKRFDDQSLVKSEKKPKPNTFSSPEPLIESPPLILDRLESPLQVAMREGTLRMFWNHYYIVGCTQEYGAMMGYKQEELLGMPWAMLHPPELSEFYIRGLENYLPTVPEYVTEVDHGCDLVMLSRSGRRFQVLCEYKMFLRNREPLMGWTIIRAILRDNLPPGYLPPSTNGGGFVEQWNRMPAIRAPSPAQAQHQHQPPPTPLPNSSPRMSFNNLAVTANLLSNPVSSVVISSAQLPQQMQFLQQQQQQQLRTVPNNSSSMPVNSNTTRAYSIQLQPAQQQTQQQQQPQLQPRTQNASNNDAVSGAGSNPSGTSLFMW